LNEKTFVLFELTEWFYGHFSHISAGINLILCCWFWI